MGRTVLPPPARAGIHDATERPFFTDRLRKGEAMQGREGLEDMVETIGKLDKTVI